MNPRPARQSRTRGVARRWPDLLVGLLAAALVTLRPLTLPGSSWAWVGAWIACGAIVVLASRARRDTESSGARRRDARLLVLAVSGIPALAALAAQWWPALGLPPLEVAPLRLQAYAVLVVLAAARLPGWAPPLALSALAAALETAALLLAGEPAPGRSWFGAGLGLAFLGALATVATALFRTGARQREALQAAIGEHQRLRQEAEELRALGDDRSEPEAEGLSRLGTTTRVMSALVAIDRDLDRVLALAALSVGGRSIVLFLLAEDGERLVVRRAFSGQGVEVDQRVEPRLGEGVVGHAARSRRPALFTNLDPASLRPPLYADGTAGSSLLIVPVTEAGVFRGVLVADAASPGAFGSDQERILAGFAGEVGTLLEYAQAEARRATRGHRFEALSLISKELSSTIKVGEVLAKMVDLTLKLVPYERCALYLFDAGRSELVLGAQRGFLPDTDAEEVRIPLDHRIPGYLATHRRELLFSDIRERHRSIEVVPGAPDQDRIRSFLGLPLTNQQELVGVWVLVAEKPGAFDAEHLDLLKVVAAQASTLIANAVLHQTVERIAVTDGLTGLYNHRSFQERLQHEIERADRQRTPVSLLLLDIDHFKRINDTHGHPFGDRVLKALATELGRMARRVDFVARYGGEEFAIILVDTGRRGCRAYAQRVLKAVRALRIPHEKGGFTFTLSIGGATCPDDAVTREELVRLADRALYAAKEGGRDRAVGAEELGSAPAAGAAHKAVGR